MRALAAGFLRCGVLAVDDDGGGGGGGGSSSSAVSDGGVGGEGVGSNVDGADDGDGVGVGVGVDDGDACGRLRITNAIAVAAPTRMTTKSERKKRPKLRRSGRLRRSVMKMVLVRKSSVGRCVVLSDEIQLAS